MKTKRAGALGTTRPTVRGFVLVGETLRLPLAASLRCPRERHDHPSGQPAAHAARHHEDPRRMPGSRRQAPAHRVPAILDKVGDVLMDRAGRTDVRDEQQLFLDARATLTSERKTLMAEFERRLRKRIDDKISGKEEAKADFSTVDIANLTLVDTQVMDESVITGNITRVVENICYDELQTLNRGIGHLMGQPDLETDGNPLAPEGIVTAFADALKSQKSDERVKFQILKELNQGSLSDLNGIYQDLNKHLRGAPRRAGCARHDRQSRWRRSPARRVGEVRSQAAGAAARSRRDGDVRRMFASGQAPMPQFGPPTERPGGPPSAYGAGRAARIRASPGAPPRWPAQARARSTSRRSSSAARDRWCRRVTSRRGRWRRPGPATSPARRSSRRRCWARGSRACRRASRASTSAAAPSSSPASRRGCRTSCATCRNPRWARRRTSSSR